MIRKKTNMMKRRVTRSKRRRNIKRRKRRSNATTENTKWQLKSLGNAILRPSPSWDKRLEK